MPDTKKITVELSRLSNSHGSEEVRLQEVGGRVESGTETESNAGAVAEQRRPA